jgi:hypothetical protein
MQQDAMIRNRFPQFQYSRTQQAWTGTMKPSDQSPEYRVKITYCQAASVKVHVISPAIKSDAPHRYHDDSLCLYHPHDKSWNSRKHIAETIIPWTAEWLFYYERWLVTKHWDGPEAPHDSVKK